MDHGPENMLTLILAEEQSVRLGFFGAMLVIIALWEIIAPRRKLTVSKARRWVANLFIVVVDSGFLRLLFPFLAAALAVKAQAAGWGLFNQEPFDQIPPWIVIPVSFLLLDMTIYFQHRMFHIIPPLWRLHMMHHSDLDFDVTTGTRFHPFEIALSMVIKMALVLALGPPAIAVILFEIALNATAMFNHGNIRLPDTVDRIVRRVLVTPDMHRVHHSVIAREHDSNYGFNLPWWDHIFRSYCAQPADGHEDMTIGLNRYRNINRLSLAWLIALPFMSAAKNPDGPADGPDKEIDGPANNKRVPEQ